VIIFYYSHASIFGRGFPRRDAEELQWNSYGTDCVWIVPGTLDEDGYIDIKTEGT
jgi:hypothetical protein